MHSIDSIDPRLIEVELELSDLNYYLDLLEKQIKERQADYRSELQEIIKENGLTPNDSNWQIVHEYKRLADYRMPRFFRAPFLISLYAVYESAVIEIANFIQKQKGIEIPITEKNKNFNLDGAKKYYKDTIDFPLYSDNIAWKRITMLSVIRHSFAQANGRIEILSSKTKDRIEAYEKRKIGISSEDGFIVIEKRFLRETFKLVNESLYDLVERYKKWDDHQKA